MPASTDDLHTYAMTAEHALEQLATGIAAVGASDADVKGISTMAHACRQIASSLAKGGTQPQAQPTTNDAISAHFAQQRAAAPAAPPAAPGY